MTRRIESEPGSTAAIVARSAPRTDVEVNPSAAPDITAPESVGYPDFDALIGEIASRRRSTRAPRSPQQIIADFIEPRISDPTPFQGGRSLSILERLASRIIPALDESEELRSLASAVIAEEIERRRELARRLHGSIAI
ncbi:hypothetical protein [Bradyrhizobium sp.]|uniref:hypothetical protein n=1 Tax=Bradyrhizobium sp. TaxID=376 RepID=UPI003C372DB1